MIIIGALLVVLGIAGSILPALPGPTLSYAGLIILFIERGSEVVPVSALIFFGIFMAFVLAIDYVAPILGARFFGASKKGLIGAIIGAILGLPFIPPFGIIIGAFVGAMLGEYFSGKKGLKTMKAGVGVILGSTFVLFIQTLYAILVAIYFFSKVF